MHLYLDTETIPSQQTDARDRVRINLRPPGTLKKPESIAAWWRDEADAAADEAYRKQSLDGGLNAEIVSIAIVDDRDRLFVRCRSQDEREADLLRDAFAAVEAWTDADAKELLPGRTHDFPLDDHCIVAHNAQFDAGLLWRRCAVLGLQRPRWLPGPMARVGKELHCTMQLWAGYGGRVSLDALCGALGVPSPKDGGIDGSMIFDAWLAGQVERIAAYNLADAIAVREVWHRLHGLPREAAA